MFIRRSLSSVLKNSFRSTPIFSSIAAKPSPSPINSLNRLFHTNHSFSFSSSASSSSASSSSSTPVINHGAHSASAVAPIKTIRGMLTVDELRHKITSGDIETVIVGFCDMYGRLMGKRFDGEFFLESGLKGGTHACDYLLASDVEMQPINGFDFANWERGFGDFHLVPDLNSIRLISWQPKTAMVLCDIFNDKTHQYVSVAPRSVLRHQLSEASKLGKYRILAASELEYYMFEQSYRQANKLNYRQSSLTPVGDYYEDYHMLQTAREEKYTREFRKHLAASGIPVENSKGECGLGQHELNVKYSTILDMSDRHLVYKQCLKELSDQMGVSVTFMAKPFTDFTGSGCHIHLSLNDDNGKNLFAGNEEIGPVKGSKLFKHFLAGWLKYTNDCMVFYAPTINSYKRFVSSSWAPTKIAWSFDNRTAGYRVVGSGQSLRIECRIPGADANPYLAFAASLASGLAGIKEELIPPPIFEGNIYEAQQLPSVPKSLLEAAEIFEKSSFAKKAFGESVVKHYAHFYKAEVEAFNKNVMDWERVRYFERI